MDRRGGEKLMSIWWFFVLIVIAVGIVAGVLINFGADVDVRDLEADILGERIVSCLTQGRELVEGSLEQGFDIFEECNLKEDKFGEGSDFYFRISFIDDNGNELREEIRGGDRSFEKDCFVGEEVEEAEAFPKCVSKRQVLKEGTEIRVLAGSNQGGRNG